jgi:hypothetical protein
VKQSKVKQKQQIMPKKISIFTGSFKPPHKGHLHVVQKMLEYTKAKGKKEKEPGVVYVFISRKERDPCPGINGKISKEVWEMFLQTLPKKNQERVKLVLSKLPSPTQTAYGFVKNIAKKGDTIYLVKSEKNADDTRYSSFRNINIKHKEMVIPGFKSLNSTNMRATIQNRKKKEFYQFLPNKMTATNKNKLWEKLKKLCKK